MSGRPRDQPMQVVAVADAQRRARLRPAAADEALGRREVVGGRDLQVARIAVDEVHAMSGTLGEHGFIGRIGGATCLRQRVAKHIDAKRLRRLREEDLVARNRLDDEALGIASLDRVGRRQRRNRRTEPDGGIDRAPDQIRRHERTRRIVNHHDIRLRRHPGERLRDGILPPLAAFDDLHRLPPAAQVVGDAGRKLPRQRDDRRRRSDRSPRRPRRCAEGSAARQAKETASAARRQGARRAPRPQ